MAIERLSTSDTVTAATRLAASIDGLDKSVTISVLTAYLETVLPTAGVLTTQYSAPGATGFSVQVTDGSDSIWLVLTPLAGYAAGTIVLPALTSSANKQEVLINCTQVVTTLTVDGNGSTVVGVPTTLAANDFFRLRYDSVLSTWYRVG